MSLYTLPPVPVSHAAQGHYAQKLLNDLMENYSNALRPVEDTDKALNVTLQITLSQIKDMVSKATHPIRFWLKDKAQDVTSLQTQHQDVTT